MQKTFLFENLARARYGLSSPPPHSFLRAFYYSLQPGLQPALEKGTARHSTVTAGGVLEAFGDEQLDSPC